MSHETWNYQQALREAGFRVTEQRELIMDIVCASSSRMTAQEICDSVREQAPEINAATVYRNLAFLTENELLHVVLSHGTKQYVLGGRSSHHHHLACKQCGRELEMPTERTEDLFQRIEQEYGFEVDEPHLILHGTCEDCRKE